MFGGEQQMLAMGLAPVFVEKVFDSIKNDEDISVFVVEQNANVAVSVADRGYVLQTGEVVLSGPAQELLNNEAMQRAYLGEV